MTRGRALTLTFVAVFTAVVIYGGTTGSFARLFGPRAMLDVSGQQHGGSHPGAAPVTGEQQAPAVLAVSGAPAAAARVFTTATVEPAKKEAKGYTLGARLVGKDGKALVDTEVAFYDVVAFQGPREMLVGVAKTDGFGTASLDYLPAQGGTHTINVRPTQWDRLAATQATATIDAARVAPSTYARERLPLDPFSARLPSVGALVVLAVWALFALVILGSAYLIPRGARRSPYIGKAREI